MTTFPTIDGIDMPASQLKKLAIPQKSTHAQTMGQS